MYNPAIHTATNKPIGLTGKPVDARSYFYDAVNYVYRPYVDTAEVLTYLNSSDRVGQFSIIVNTGGSLVSGVITGGTNSEWWFKDGVSDGDLVLKGTGGLIEIPVTAGDHQPLTIPHPGMTWPSVLYRNADGSRYAGATDTDDGSNIIVTGDPQDDGSFADSFTVIIKA